jgi:hypothetical protein
VRCSAAGLACVIRCECEGREERIEAHPCTMGFRLARARAFCWLRLAAGRFTEVTE